MLATLNMHGSVVQNIVDSGLCPFFTDFKAVFAIVYSGIDFLQKPIVALRWYGNAVPITRICHMRLNNFLQFFYWKSPYFPSMKKKNFLSKSCWKRWQIQPILLLQILYWLFPSEPLSHQFFSFTLLLEQTYKNIITHIILHQSVHLRTSLHK